MSAKFLLFSNRIEAPSHIVEVRSEMPDATRFTGKITRESHHILGQLLQDFRQRGLTSDDLEAGYVGVSSSELREKSLGADSTNTAVDFDLALEELEEQEIAVFCTGLLIDRGAKLGALPHIVTALLDGLTCALGGLFGICHDFSRFLR